MKVVILCGISGSGKSTYAKKNYPRALVCSADNFFLENGNYLFDSSRLSEAHKSCLQSFIWGIGNEIEQIVVDNTNTTAIEVAPYAAIATAFNYELEIIILRTNPWEGAARNIHNVPLKTIEAQHNRLLKLRASLPVWWLCKEIDVCI